MAATTVHRQNAEFSIPLPLALDTKIHVKVMVKRKTVLVFLTTVSADQVGSPTPLGSFVYALPDVRRCQSPLPLSFPSRLQVANRRSAEI